MGARGMRIRGHWRAMSAACEKFDHRLINLQYPLQKLIHLQFVEFFFSLKVNFLLKPLDMTPQRKQISPPEAICFPLRAGPCERATSSNKTSWFKWWVSFAPDFQCCYFCESSYLFYLRFNFDFYVSKIMHL